MRIAIASGKGGTGKTTVTVSLSLAIQELTKKPVTILDCDVEEPNAHIFLSLPKKQLETATIQSCSFDTETCTGCGRCSDACRFNAIAVVKKKPIFFSDMCHGCGGCILACPENAITGTQREIGTVISGDVQENPSIDLHYGLLNVGEIMAPPLIESVLAKEHTDSITIIDSPPGTSCPMVQAVRTSDYVILVTEPTAFGLNDLKIAVETVRLLQIPFSVIINREGIGDDRVHRFCQQENIEILTEIPQSRNVAILYSKGQTAWKKEQDFTKAVQKAGTLLVERFHL
ncbi:MAG: ATP-binding protein [Caldisericia bacterium]|nr:ATP-binding protein [Caldisericia bacterium]MDD4614717.1 ATP-binding protein [Caldisericia bacterium]